MERKKFNLWRLLRNLIIGAIVATIISAVLMEAAPEIVSPSRGENAMFAFLFIALSAGMYGIFAILRFADTERVNRTSEESSEAAFNIDDHVCMAADARRYRWLRDVAFDTPRQDLVPRDRQGNLLIEQDLDSEIDCAMHAYPGEQEDEPCAD